MTTLTSDAPGACVSHWLRSLAISAMIPIISNTGVTLTTVVGCAAQ